DRGIQPNMIAEFLDERGPRRCHASIVRTNLCWMYSPVNNRGLQVNELFVFLHRSCQSKPRRSIDERNPPWLMKASDSLQRAMPHHNTRGRNEKVLPQQSTHRVAFPKVEGSHRPAVLWQRSDHCASLAHEKALSPGQQCAAIVE